MIYHLAVVGEWEGAGERYAPGAFAVEGFVHCSYAEQVRATAARHYAGRDDVVLLEIDEARLDAPLVVEPSPTTGEHYPHVYGTIARTAVIAVHDLATWSGDGERHL